MKNFNYKTMIPAVIGAGVLVYEAYTGHSVDKSTSDQLVNGALLVAGTVATVIGIIKNHKRGA